jgi:hypothetical protein
MNKNRNVVIELAEIPRNSLRILAILAFMVILPFFIIHPDAIQNNIILELRPLLETSIFSMAFRMLWVAAVFLIAVMLGIVLHEAIHALFFSFYLSSKYQGVKFGFDEQHGIPFVHLKEPISVLGFRVGAIMPMILLGVIPAALGVYYGSISLTAYGIIFIISASGDLLLIARTAGIPHEYMLKDMPDAIGFEIIKRV